MQCILDTETKHNHIRQRQHELPGVVKQLMQQSWGDVEMNGVLGIGLVTRLCPKMKFGGMHQLTTTRDHNNQDAKCLNLRVLHAA